MVFTHCSAHVNDFFLKQVLKQGIGISEKAKKQEDIAGVVI